MATLTGVTKGQPKKVSVKFGSEPLREIPDWEVTDWEGNRLENGAAINEGGGEWSATFTLPKNLYVPDGAQDIEVTFDAITQAGVYREKSRVLTVVDVADDWKTYGILYYPKGGMPQKIKENILLPEKASKISLEIRDGFGMGNLLYSKTETQPEERSSSDLGWQYDVQLENVLLDPASGGYYPHNLVITASFESGAPDDMIIKPIYTLTPLAISHLHALKRYLDKARLEEIDPNIGWQDEELIHYLMQGAMLINGFNEVSYWTVETMPPTLNAHLQKAAEWEALNARYIAEGMVEFDWQGANTQLQVDRKQVIQTKMDEINSWLDARLPQAKKSALQTFGPGQPPPGIQAGRRTIGALHITVGPTTNYTVPHRRRMYGYPYRY